MKLEQLQDFFPTERRAELAQRYAAWLAERGATDDPEGFLAELHERGVITSDTLFEILTLHDVALAEAPVDSTLPRARHRLLTLVGKGAMGEVYVGHDPQLQRTVAVKRLDPRLVEKRSALTRFYAEAQITAQLDHPSIVPIYGLEADAEGRLAYAMKFVRGKTLTEVLTDAMAALARGRMPESLRLHARLELFLPVLNAMAYAHRRGILHRDLKPDNIMIGPFGEVLVMDWGIARPIGKRERVTKTQGVVEKTRVGAVIGTPAFMSPEQARGESETLDAASDQYALGLILFEVASLGPAIPGTDALEVLTRAASGKRATLVARDPREPIPRELAAIIDRATALEPAARYPSVEAMADDLKRFLRDESVQALPDRGLRRIERWVGRHRGPAIAIAAAILVVAIGAILLVRALDREAAREREARFQGLGALVAGQVTGINLQLARYEALVQGIAAAGAALLAEPDPVAIDPALVIYQYREGRRFPEALPPDAEHSAFYDAKMTFPAPDLSAPGRAELAPLRAQAAELRRLGPTLERALLASHSEEALALPDAEARRLVFAGQVPAVWTYAATTDGVQVSMPGSFDDTLDPEDADTVYDPREMGWFQSGLAARRPVWTSAGGELSRFGQLISCVVSMRDGDDRVVGVAGIDLTFRYFIERLLVHPAIATTGAESLLVDDGGMVVLRSTQDDLVRYKPVAWGEPDALAAIRARPAGHAELPDGRLVVWARLHAMPWTYVVLGARDELMALDLPSTAR